MRAAPQCKVARILLPVLAAIAILATAGSLLLADAESRYHSAQIRVPTITLTLGSPSVRVVANVPVIHNTCTAVERAVSARLQQLWPAPGNASKAVTQAVQQIVAHMHGRHAEMEENVSGERDAFVQAECVAVRSVQQLVQAGLSSPMRVGALLASPNDMKAVWVYQAHMVSDNLVLHMALPNLPSLYMGAVEALSLGGKAAGRHMQPTTVPVQSRLMQFLKQNGLSVDFALWQSGSLDLTIVANQYILRDSQALLLGVPVEGSADPLLSRIPLTVQLLSETIARMSLLEQATGFAGEPDQQFGELRQEAYDGNNGNSKEQTAMQLQLLHNLQESLLSELEFSIVEEGPYVDARRLASAEVPPAAQSVGAAKSEPVYTALDTMSSSAVNSAAYDSSNVADVESSSLHFQNAGLVLHQGLKSGGLYGIQHAEGSEPVLVGKLIEVPAQDATLQAMVTTSNEGLMHQELGASYQVVAGGAGSALTNTPFEYETSEADAYEYADIEEADSPLERLQILTKYITASRAAASDEGVQQGPSHREHPASGRAAHMTAKVSDITGDDVLQYVLSHHAAPSSDVATNMASGIKALSAAFTPFEFTATQGMQAGIVHLDRTPHPVDHSHNLVSALHMSEGESQRHVPDIAHKSSSSWTQEDANDESTAALPDYAPVHLPGGRNPRVHSKDVSSYGSAWALNGPFVLQDGSKSHAVPMQLNMLHYWLQQQIEQLAFLNRLGMPGLTQSIDFSGPGRKLTGVNWALTGPGIALAALGLIMLCIAIGACCVKWRLQRRERKLKKQDIAKRFPMGAQFYDPVRKPDAQKGPESAKLTDNDILAHQMAMQREAELIRARHGHGYNPAARQMALGTPTGTPGANGRPITPLPYRAETPLPAYARAGQTPWRAPSFYSEYGPPATPGAGPPPSTGAPPGGHAFPGGYKGIAAVAVGGDVAGRPVTATRMTPAGLDQRPGTAMSGMSGWGSIPPGSAPGEHANRQAMPPSYQPPMGERYNPQAVPNMSQPPSRSLTPLANSVEGGNTPRGAQPWTPPDNMSTYGSTRFEHYVLNHTATPGTVTEAHTPKSSDPRYTPMSGESRPNTAGAFSAYDGYSHPSSMVPTQPRAGQPASYGVPGTPLYPVGRQFDPSAQRPIFTPASPGQSPSATPERRRPMAPQPPSRADSRPDMSGEPETQSTSSKVDVSLASSGSFLRSDIRLGQL